MNALREGGSRNEAPLVVRPLPEYIRHWVLLGLGSAVVLAFLLWLARNLLSDQIAYWAAESAGTEAAYQQYLSYGWLHKEAAGEKLAAAALLDARKAGTVTAFRSVATRYAGSAVEAEARAEVHKLYVDALDAYRRRAGSDPRVRSFLERLLAYLEESGTAAVEVHFIRPRSGVLESGDRRLQGRAAVLGRQLAAMSPHFTSESALAREQSMLSQLNAAFVSIFPADVMTLALGEPLEGSPAGPVDEPVILIEYNVIPTGEFYELQGTSAFLQPLFVGIRILFNVQMRFPQSLPLSFRVEVAPPDHFNVDYTSTNQFVDTGPPEGRVYSVMAERAFDQLSEKLRALFVSTDEGERGTKAGAR